MNRTFEEFFQFACDEERDIVTLSLAMVWNFKRDPRREYYMIQFENLYILNLRKRYPRVDKDEMLRLEQVALAEIDEFMEETVMILRDFFPDAMEKAKPYKKKPRVFASKQEEEDWKTWKIITDPTDADRYMKHKMKEEQKILRERERQKRADAAKKKAELKKAEQDKKKGARVEKPIVKPEFTTRSMKAASVKFEEVDEVLEEEDDPNQPGPSSRIKPSKSSLYVFEEDWNYREGSSSMAGPSTSSSMAPSSSSQIYSDLQDGDDLMIIKDQPTTSHKKSQNPSKSAIKAEPQDEEDEDDFDTTPHYYGIHSRETAERLKERLREKLSRDFDAREKRREERRLAREQAAAAAAATPAPIPTPPASLVQEVPASHGGALIKLVDDSSSPAALSSSRPGSSNLFVSNDDVPSNSGEGSSSMGGPSSSSSMPQAAAPAAPAPIPTPPASLVQQVSESQGRALIKLVNASRLKVAPSSSMPGTSNLFVLNDDSSSNTGEGSSTMAGPSSSSSMPHAPAAAVPAPIPTPTGSLVQQVSASLGRALIKHVTASSLAVASFLARPGTSNLFVLNDGLRSNSGEGSSAMAGPPSRTAPINDDLMIVDERSSRDVETPQRSAEHVVVKTEPVDEADFDQVNENPAVPIPDSNPNLKRKLDIKTEIPSIPLKIKREPVDESPETSDAPLSIGSPSSVQLLEDSPAGRTRSQATPVDVKPDVKALRLALRSTTLAARQDSMDVKPMVRFRTPKMEILEQTSHNSSPTRAPRNRRARTIKAEVPDEEPETPTLRRSARVMRSTRVTVKTEVALRKSARIAAAPPVNYAPQQASRRGAARLTIKKEESTDPAYNLRSRRH